MDKNALDELRGTGMPRALTSAAHLTAAAHPAPACTALVTMSSHEARLATQYQLDAAAQYVNNLRSQHESLALHWTALVQQAKDGEPVEPILTPVLQALIASAIYLQHEFAEVFAPDGLPAEDAALYASALRDLSAHFYWVEQMMRAELRFTELLAPFGFCLDNAPEGERAVAVAASASLSAESAGYRERIQQAERMAGEKLNTFFARLPPFPICEQ